MTYEKKKIEAEIKHQEAYLQSELNAELYSNFRVAMNQLWESERYFLTSEFIVPKMKILDIGGASGGVGKAIRESISEDIEYYCVDPDAKAVANGSQIHPYFNFAHCFFPCDIESFGWPSRYDYVMLMGWFAQVTDWKIMFQELMHRSSRYLNLGMNFRLEGTTVVDPDVSYFYYLDSGIRVPVITHNLYEFLNYISHHEFGVKKISVYAYHVENKKSSAFRPLSRDSIIQGNILIEKFTNDQSFPRIGGISNESERFLGSKYRSFKPELLVVIDRKIQDVNW